MTELHQTHVDVVVPTIGRESLRRAVRSANSQTVPNHVFVVSDRLDITAEITQLLTGLEYTLLSTNGAEGGAVARNIGFNAGNAEYVAFLDDDDWWDPVFLESRLTAASHRDDCCLVIGAFRHERNETSVIVPSTTPPVTSPRDILDYMVRRDRLRFGRNAVQSSSLLFKRASLPENPWNGQLKKHQDWDLVARLTLQPNAVVEWDPLALAHVAKDSPGSVSKASVWQASLDWWQQLGPEMSGRASADFLAVHVLRAALRARSAKGTSLAFKHMPAPPHASALFLGLSGVVR